MGADIRALEYKKRTPLELAVKRNHWRVVRVLLAHGADPGLPGGFSCFARPTGAFAAANTARMRDILVGADTDAPDSPSSSGTPGGGGGDGRAEQRSPGEEAFSRKQMLQMFASTGAGGRHHACPVLRFLPCCGVVSACRVS